MSRNKYPEQTLEKILDTSARLFTEKGYEQTSIQNILDALGLSKGGLYHHFNSKEEILEAVLKRRADYIAGMLNLMIENTHAPNAREKLKLILLGLGADAETRSLDHVMASQFNNPYFIVNGIQTNVNQDAKIIGRLIEEGLQDGSLHVIQPEMCAEIFLLLMNLWANPILFGRNFAATKERLKYLQLLMSQLGLDILDDELIDTLLNRYEKAGVFEAI